MLYEELLDKIQAKSCQFNEVIDFIERNFTFMPTEFKNGETLNEAGQNSGSCKIFAFAKHLEFSKEQTLECFGTFYRQDVLENPDAENHQNIRNFMKFGWEGIKFNSEALTKK
jgi:HopJ type III effector protein